MHCGQPHYTHTITIIKAIPNKTWNIYSLAFLSYLSFGRQKKHIYHNKFSTDIVFMKTYFIIIYWWRLTAWSPNSQRDICISFRFNAARFTMTAHEANPNPSMIKTEKHDRHFRQMENIKRANWTDAISVPNSRQNKMNLINTVEYATYLTYFLLTIRLYCMHSARNCLIKNARISLVTALL